MWDLSNWNEDPLWFKKWDSALFTFLGLEILILAMNKIYIYYHTISKKNYTFLLIIQSDFSFTITLCFLAPPFLVHLWARLLTSSSHLLPGQLNNSFLFNGPKISDMLNFLLRYFPQAADLTWFLCNDVYYKISILLNPVIITSLW